MPSVSAEEFTWTVRVYYEDTDAGGVVYHANYLKFLERARSEWLRSRGFSQDRLMQEEHAIFAVRQILIDYLKPACFDNLLKVNVKILHHGRASLRFGQNIYDESGVTLCQAKVLAVCLDPQNFRPRAIPESILAEIKNGC
jgi:acyl-CoA thioester hydrolase